MLAAMAVSGCCRLLSLCWKESLLLGLGLRLCNQLGFSDGVVPARAGDPVDVFKYMAKFGLPDNTCLSCALLLLACCCGRCSA